MRDDEGITAIEYGLIAALMAGALGGIIGALTGGLDTAFDAIVARLTGA
jgi:pilus assembly protein Flp/PilA